MHAACATEDHDWALEHLRSAWPTFLDAPIHRTAYIACAAHSAHVRLLLNVHVAKRDRTDPMRLVGPDLRALARLPATAFRDGVVLRVRARCAYLSGDAAGAAALLRQSAKAMHEASILDEVERERFALGCMLGGEEGAQLCAAAEAALRALGVRLPREELRGYYPELFAAGLAPRA